VIVLDCFQVSIVFASICLCVSGVLACFRVHGKVSVRSHQSVIVRCGSLFVLCFVS
jgi:hypothetical protein